MGGRKGHARELHGKERDDGEPEPCQKHEEHGGLDDPFGAHGVIAPLRLMQGREIRRQAIRRRGRLRPPRRGGPAAVAFGLAFERDLDHRHDRIGQRQPEDAEQHPEDQLRAQHQRRGEVGGLLGDHRHDHIAIDRLHHEIDDDAVDPHVGPARKADQNHHQPRERRPDIGQEHQQAGHDAQQRRHRHAVDRQQNPGRHALGHHADHPPEQQHAQRLAHALERDLEVRPGVEREHPGQAPPVDIGFEREIDAQDHDQEERGNPAEQPAQRMGHRPTPPITCSAIFE
jgi:hypothetical protein